MLINEIRDDLREECEKFGVVKKVLLFDVREYHQSSIVGVYSGTPLITCSSPEMRTPQYIGQNQDP